MAAAAPLLHHDLAVVLAPAAHRLSVDDTVTLPDRPAAEGGTAYFLLRAGLAPTSRTPGVEVRRVEDRPRPSPFGPGAPAATLGGDVARALYRVDLPPGTDRFTLAYGGEVAGPPAGGGDAPGGPRPSGAVSDDGVFLAADSGWYPWFGPDLVTFRLDVRLPPGWDAVSQGGREFHERDDRGTRVCWTAETPQDDVYLVAGRFAETDRQAGPVALQVFLRRPDPALADRYLEAGARYLRLYADLLGPYPYPKFALVENFWETGYGMPSFSLLGPRVIRFPFILHSSYPHEILHNWWGNGVYVDGEGGNWCEGLTAYLADHLIREARGAGAAYRQATLQKYADSVSRGQDFSLAAFRSRHDAATEAVGYGKGLLFFHMLRRRLGDEAFVEGLRRFYRQYRFRTASFPELRRCLESVSGEDLTRDFEQWVRRDGAPRLAVAEVGARGHGKEWTLDLKLLQTQPGAPYHLRVPVAVTVAGREAACQAVVAMDRRATRVELDLPSRPLRVDVDPEFDLFRRLDPAETPPALSGVFGAASVLVVVPSRGPRRLREGYRELAEGWARSQSGRWEIVTDDDLEALPVERAVWLFGWENRFRDGMARALAPYDAALTRDGVRFAGAEVGRAGHSLVAVARRPEASDTTVAWLATDRVAALPGLGRKLPHYHQQSYLVFQGDGPENVVQGRWPVLDSPLTAFLPTDRKPPRPEPVPMGSLPPRRPLASVAPGW